MNALKCCVIIALCAITASLEAQTVEPLTTYGGSDRNWNGLQASGVMLGDHFSPSDFQRIRSQASARQELSVQPVRWRLRQHNGATAFGWEYAASAFRSYSLNNRTNEWAASASERLIAAINFARNDEYQQTSAWSELGLDHIDTLLSEPLFRISCVSSENANGCGLLGVQLPAGSVETRGDMIVFSDGTVVDFDITHSFPRDHVLPTPEAFQDFLAQRNMGPGVEVHSWGIFRNTERLESYVHGPEQSWGDLGTVRVRAFVSDRGPHSVGIWFALFHHFEEAINAWDPTFAESADRELEQIRESDEQERNRQGLESFQ